MAEVIVTIAHLRSAPTYNRRRGYCAAGARAWFARYGLDWSAFLREGIAASKLDATGDALGAALASHARQVEAQNA